MTMPKPLAEVREIIKDEHYLQNLLVQHDGVLTEREVLKNKIAELQGRLGESSNENARQKRQIQALQDEVAQAKTLVDEMQAKILSMAGHPDVKAARVQALEHKLSALKLEQKAIEAAIGRTE